MGEARTTYRFTCTLAQGLHARPASMLVSAIGSFEARVCIAKIPGGTPVDARSVLSIVGLDVRQGDACEVTTDGRDAAAALAAFRTCAEALFAAGEEALPAGSCTPQRLTLPRVLQELRVAHLIGQPVSPGVAIAEAVCLNDHLLAAQTRHTGDTSVDHELDAARRGVDFVKHDLARRATHAPSRVERDVLHAHAAIAGDPTLWLEIDQGIRAGASAIQSIAQAGDRLSERLRHSESTYIRERTADVHDVCLLLLDHLSGGRVSATQVQLIRESVVFAEMLTPNQLLRLDRSLLKGLVLGHVGLTSHTVILARSLRIPAIINVQGAGRAVPSGTRVALHAGEGYVVTHLSDKSARYFQRDQEAAQERARRLAPEVRQPAVTVDGVRLEIGASASTEYEVAGALDDGAEGVGLFRTELLFLDRTSEPSEDEQYEAYARVVNAARGTPVIARTFDIGGDKPAPYLPMSAEANPFLGVRGVRLYERFPGELRRQLRAILRAASMGPVKIMAPMVSLVSEARWFKQQVRDCEAELAREGVVHAAGLPMGVMIEVPSLSMAMDHLCKEVDFVSIGTNDLCQYWMAADRGNEGVSRLYSPLHPSFIRLLREIVQAARESGTWVGMCGEMASTVSNLPLMVGLGVHEISVAPGEVVGMKTGVAAISASDCRRLLDLAARCEGAEEVRALLESGVPQRSEHRAIVEVDIIDAHADATTKAEAIRDAINLLYSGCRVRDVREVEDAAWAREETYSTGLGHGFAVPHCKSAAVLSPALSVLRLNAPVDWGSMDGLPVRMVLLLAMPATEAAGGGGTGHIKVFAALARKLMHEDFREQLLGAHDPATILRVLRDALQLD